MKGGSLKSSERDALSDARLHRLMDGGGLAKLALALGTLARSKVAQAWLAAHDLARSGYFEPLGGRFFRLATCD